MYRVAWQSGRDEEATLVGRSMHSANKPSKANSLELGYGGKTVVCHARSGQLTIGRATDAGLPLNDLRVSRLHATLAWRGGNFVLTDASSYGAWVYSGMPSDGVLLRRTDCYLSEAGFIVPGCERGDENAPLISFLLKS